MQNLSASILRTPSAAIAVGLGAILAATLLLTWPALNGPFLFDDFPNLEQLAMLNGRTDWNSLANFAAQYRSEPGRPLSMLSFVLNDSDWPTSPWPFKYTNLMLHLLVGVVVFGFTRTLARSRTPTQLQADLVALFASAAWLLHPMQLSTSMLVVQRMTQLSALFAVGGTWAYAAIAIRARTPRAAFAAIAVLGASTILSVLSKEVGALTPLLALVLNTTLLRDRLAGLPPAPRRILYWGTALPVLALLAAIAWRWEGVTGYGSRNFGMAERVLSEARALCDYLFRILLPSLRGGGIYHDDFAVSRGLADPWSTAPAVLAVALLVGIALWRRRRWPVFAFAILWFFAGHLLESTVFPLELYFEHRNYVPMIGILFALAYWVVSARDRRRKPLMALAVAWIAFAAWLTSVQAPIWGNRDALVSVWAIEHPGSPRATQEKAAYFHRHGRQADAAATLLDAYARGVRGSDFPVQVLLLACMTRDHDMARDARASLLDALRSSEYNRATPVTLRKLRLQVQQDKCPTVATEDDWLSLTALLLQNPNFASGEAASYLRIERAYLYEHRRNLNSTMLELEQAWEQNPTPELAQLIAATLLSAGLYDPAEQWANKALEHRTPGLRGLFSSDEVASARMLEIIRTARSRSKAMKTPDGAASGRAP